MSPSCLIYLIGVDGSGKTTVARHIEQHLREKNYSVYRVWATLHPVILWPIIKIAKLLFVRKHSKYENYIEHTKVKMEAVNRFRFFLKPLFILSLLDYYPQYLWKVVRKSRSYDYLICDRYYVDMLMERAVLVSLGPLRFPDWLRRYGWIFRAPDISIYLRTAPSVAFMRKTDIPSEAYLLERTHYYDAVAQVLQAHIIDADQPLPAVCASVEAHIEAYHR